MGVIGGGGVVGGVGVGGEGWAVLDIVSSTKSPSELSEMSPERKPLWF